MGEEDHAQAIVIEERRKRPASAGNRNRLVSDSYRCGKPCRRLGTGRLQPSYRVLLRRLEDSEVYRTYCDSFRLATGLPLRLVHASVMDDSTDQSHDGWAAGGRHPRDENGHGFSPATDPTMEAVTPSAYHTGIAGRDYAMVPISLGKMVIAYLTTARTTQSRRQGPESRDHSLVAPAQFLASVKLLSYFASKLVEMVEGFELMDRGSDPIGLVEARRYINRHLPDPLPLSLVARQARLSESHFCRLFKEHMGLTLTDYVAHRRIAWAKRELLRPALRISEVAFKVGFQSLSQFNRTFSRVVGCSPSAYRVARIEDGKLLEAPGVVERKRTPARTPGS